MRDAVDLHIHSHNSSDGDFSVFHIIKLAQEKKLRAISISDHDTVAAYPEAIELGKKAGVEVIPSIELTTIFESREFHLLLPFVNWKKNILKKTISLVAQKREEEARERVEKLRVLGFDITWKEVKKRTRSVPPLGVTIAQMLLEQGEKNGDPAFNKYLKGSNKLFAPYLFYRDFFMEGKPAYVPKRNIDLLDVLDVVASTGGVPTLAHPGAYFQRVTKKDLVVLRENGLEGLEVHTSYHDPHQTKIYRKMADELDLVATVGSDFHGSIKPHISFGSMNSGGYGIVEALLKRRE
jgi:predicted metal-dependent phosphoesterase TrpH